MVIPYALGSDQRQVEFLVQCGYRYVEGIGLLRFCTIAEIYGLYGRLQKLCAVLLGILCQTFIQIHNVLGRHNHMNGHLSVLYGQSSLSLVKFIYMEHTAVCIEICGVNAVLQCRCCRFFCVSLFRLRRFFCLGSFLIGVFRFCGSLCSRRLRLAAAAHQQCAAYNCHSH